MARSTDGGIKIESQRIDFGKDRRGAHLEHGVGDRDKSERWNDDLVTFANAECEQCQVQACGAGTDGDGVGDRVIPRQRRFEGRELRPEAQVRRAQNGCDGVDLCLV